MQIIYSIKVRRLQLPSAAITAVIAFSRTIANNKNCETHRLVKKLMEILKRLKHR